MENGPHTRALITMLSFMLPSMLILPQMCTFRVIPNPSLNGNLCC